MSASQAWTQPTIDNILRSPRHTNDTSTTRRITSPPYRRYMTKHLNMSALLEHLGQTSTGSHSALAGQTVRIPTLQPQPAETVRQITLLCHLSRMKSATLASRGHIQSLATDRKDFQAPMTRPHPPTARTQHSLAYLSHLRRGILPSLESSNESSNVLIWAEVTACHSQLCDNLMLRSAGSREVSHPRSSRLGADCSRKTSRQRGTRSRRGTGLMRITEKRRAGPIRPNGY